jgi:hypothetical protein
MRAAATWSHRAARPSGCATCAGGGELHIGRRVERFTAVELADADKPELLRAYLRNWKMEVGIFFDGVGPDATDEQLLAIAPGYPVFRITPA